jgi:hypothetical protein
MLGCRCGGCRQNFVNIGPAHYPLAGRSGTFDEAYVCSLRVTTSITCYKVRGLDVLPHFFQV